MSRYSLPLTMPRINARNAMIDIDGLKQSLQSLDKDIQRRNQLKENEMMGERLAAGDLQGAEEMAFRNGNLDQGLAIRTRRQSEGDQQTERERQLALRTAGYFQNYVMKETDPLRKKSLVTSWLRSNPGADKEIMSAGIDPEDYEGVARFVIAEAQPFLDQKAQADLERINASRDSEIAQAAKYRSETIPTNSFNLDNFGMDADGNLVRVENRVAGASDSQDGSMSYGTTGGVDFGPTGVQSGDVPGVVVQDGGKAAPRWVSQEREGQGAIANSSAEQQASIRRLREAQAVWRATYGKDPPSGYIYAQDGSLIDLKNANSRGTSKTQAAAAGAMEEAANNIELARQAITGQNMDRSRAPGGGTNMVSRGFSQALDSGQFAKARSLVEIAARSIMHGMSGAQVNIPETESYMRAYMPQWNDTQSRIHFKLNAMKSMLGSIRLAVEGKKRGDPNAEAQIAQIRQQMAKDLLGIDAPQDMPPVRSKGTGTGFEGMSDDDLLRELER